MVLLEVCVDSQASARAALAGGADRIELCSSLQLGGLTPSVGLCESVAKLCGNVPLAIMIRPRQGGFEYDADDLSVMCADVGALSQYASGGVVFGALQPDCSVDTSACRAVCDVARGCHVDTVFHRAFDLVSDQQTALERLIALEFARVLTSGGCASVGKGVSALRRLVLAAQGRTVVMPGGGLNEANAGLVALETQASQFHASCSVVRELPALPVIGEAQAVRLRVTSAEKVKAIKNNLSV